MKGVMFNAVPIGALQRRACRVATVLVGTLWFCSPSSVLAQTVQFSYSAKDEWADSQIMLFPGDRVTVDTKASWSNVGQTDALFNQFGLTGVLIGGTYLPEAAVGTALVRVGDRIWPAFDRSITVERPGRLLFAMNDVPGTYGDNRGDATVMIRMTLTQVVMPSFRGRTVAEAEKYLAPLGLKPDVQTGQSELDEGLIYDHLPQRGTDLHRLQPLVLYVSAGPAPVAIPDVVGQADRDAMRILRSASLSPVSAGAEASTLPARRVTRTDPVAQTMVKREANVRFWVASGENLVPDVIDWSAADGERQIRDAGFTDVRMSLVESAGHDGMIIEQAPPPYTTAALATPVELMVGQSPRAGPPAELDTPAVPTGRRSMWPYMVVGILGLGAAGGGAFRLTQRRKRIRTERHVQVRSSLDPETNSALPDDVAASQVEIKVTLVAGATEFSQPPEILSNEVRNG